MAREQPRGEKAAVDPDGVLPPLLDQSRMQTERRAATHRLLARLKSLGAPQGAETPRAHAHRYVREQESLILGLLNAGVGTDEILTDLALTFPSIPTADFRHAIAQLRDRRRKFIGASATTAAGPPASTQASGSSGEPAVSPAATDQRPEESDEDYQLRKVLEGSADQHRQFIGEQ